MFNSKGSFQRSWFRSKLQRFCWTGFREFKLSHVPFSHPSTRLPYPQQSFEKVRRICSAWVWQYFGAIFDWVFPLHFWIILQWLNCWRCHCVSAGFRMCLLQKIKQRKQNELITSSGKQHRYLNKKRVFPSVSFFTNKTGVAPLQKCNNIRWLWGCFRPLLIFSQNRSHKSAIADHIKTMGP